MVVVPAVVVPADTAQVVRAVVEARRIFDDLGLIQPDWMIWRLCGPLSNSDILALSRNPGGGF